MKHTTTLGLALVFALAPSALAQRPQAGQHQERGHTQTPARQGQEHTGQQREHANGAREQGVDAQRGADKEVPRPKDHQGEEVVRPKDQRQGEEVVRPKDQHGEEVVRPKDQHGPEVQRPKDARDAGRVALPANYRGLLESYAAEERKHMERNARIQRLQELAANHHQPERVEALQDLFRRERLRYIAYQEDLRARVGDAVFEKLQHDLEALKLGKLHGRGHGEAPGHPVRPHEAPAQGERDHADAPRHGERDATPERPQQKEHTGGTERHKEPQRPARGTDGGGR